MSRLLYRLSVLHRQKLRFQKLHPKAQSCQNHVRKYGLQSRAAKKLVAAESLLRPLDVGRAMFRSSLQWFFQCKAEEFAYLPRHNNSSSIEK